MIIKAEDRDIDVPLFRALQVFLLDNYPKCTDDQAHALAQHFMRDYWLQPMVKGAAQAFLSKHGGKGRV